jgi:hypothetical protein
MSVRVVARIRPLLGHELDKDIIVQAASTDSGSQNTLVRIPSPKNEAEEFTFAFNSVLDQSATQEQLFTEEGMQHLLDPARGLYASLTLSACHSCSPHQVTLPRT